MTTKPKQGEPTKKMVGDKEFHWCTKHEAWGRHKPQDCEGKGVKRSDLKSANKAADKAQALKLSKALSSIVEQDDDDGSESEDESESE